MENLFIVLSWIGTAILVLRGLPQACQSYIKGHSKGLNPSMLWLWMMGSALLLPHLLYIGSLAVSTIYLANIIFVIIILRYLYFPRHKEKPQE